MLYGNFVRPSSLFILFMHPEYTMVFVVRSMLYMHY